MPDFPPDSIADFLFAEAAAIDEQRWDDWNTGFLHGMGSMSWSMIRRVKFR
jgi:3-phenylpropionate/cinnamic acid dioxygenase small subunit